MNVIAAIRTLSSALDVDVFTTDFEIVAFLYCNGKGGIEEIRSNVRGSPGAISYKIKHLVKSGLVIRRAGEVDARMSFYELAPAALDLFNAIPLNPEPQAKSKAA